MTTSELQHLSHQELAALRSQSLDRYHRFQAQDLDLDMTRGKPGPDQLDLANPLLEVVSAEDFNAADGTDCRNYGGLDGLPEAKTLFADFMGVRTEEILIGGNASLNLMYDSFMRAMVFGVGDGQPPWSQQGALKFLCPAPGYDRHFAICEQLDIEMITVAMGPEGPDMDQVETLAASDEAIKGIWCVPKYSNPGGIVYSDRVIQRLAAMQVAAADFRIFWDNAYAYHHLTDTVPEQTCILAACKAAGNPDRVYMYGSTSKISFAGAGVAVMAASKANIEWTRKQIFFQTIGPDKLNQLRHVRFFGNIAGIQAHMKRHQALLAPKFAAVQAILRRELGGTGVATWSDPKGGYFVSIDTPAGCARKVVRMAAEAGVKLTGAGATFPYGKDPRDCNIRIAPSLPPVEEIEQAMELVAVCIKIAAIDLLLDR
ncbi:MAG: aminotransferase class I/II-fold pyridoxal phosphate-dependent enzyme [Desulfosarcinaceae bacterium]|nr:aminotransferase class I/II-fold pyridoxal phosphate-dependent enzyme [Desulfosarcinaceae bacterium]